MTSLAFVFPGQGSQSVCMLSALAETYSQVGATFSEASAVLGFDLWQLVSAGPEEKLNQTEYTQPAMLAAGVATWRVWCAQSAARPQIMAGHSLGEYTALVCAEAMTFSDAVALVADRGRFMQAAVPPGTGAMAAILGLDDAAVVKLCADAAEGEVLSPVNFNSPGQIVIAGTAAAVARAVAAAKGVGAKRALPLPVSVPSHCALMAPAAAAMKTRLEGVAIRSPAIGVIHNYHVQTETDPSAIRAALIRQIDSPVRWVETVEKMAAAGVTRCIECGPGAVLTGLNKRIDKNINTVVINDPASLSQALAVVA